MNLVVVVFALGVISLSDAGTYTCIKAFFSYKIENF